MNVEYINPFVKASKSVLKTAVNLDIDIGKIYLKTSPYPSNTIAIIIGFMGQIKGQAIISMEKDIAIKIASTMMGTKIEKLDELSKSAITEVTNMILGNAATILDGQGINIEITPPSLLMGENMEVSTPKMKAVCIPLNINSGGTIELDVALVE